jgi:RHS repeat-associated protein
MTTSKQYDHLNRLTQISPVGSADTPPAISFAYQYTNNFLYDVWNLVAVLNPPSSLFKSFMWGSDLSGSMQGAGGVGGLLEVSYYGNATTNCFPAFDGNGNVAALVNAADGTELAAYEYGPFGEAIRATGPLARNNPFRFSTKYDDDESDLLYYGYRYYKPSTGVWAAKDPIEELGFPLSSGIWRKRGVLIGRDYIFSRNDPALFFDPFGLCCPGDKRKCKCVTFVTKYGYNPGQYEFAAQISSITGNLETFEEILDAAGLLMITDGLRFEEALAEAASSIMNSGQAAGLKVADGIEGLLQEMTENSTSGYGAYTKLSWQECKSGWLWNSWKNQTTDWNQLIGAGEQGVTAFVDPGSAVEAAAKSCQSQLQDCQGQSN